MMEGSPLRLVAVAAAALALETWTTVTAEPSSARPSAARCSTSENGQGNGYSVAAGNGSGNAGTSDGRGNGQGDDQVIDRGNGRCDGAGSRNPRLNVAITHVASRLGIRVGLAGGAKGVTRIMVFRWRQRVRVRGRYPHYTATVTHAGEWTVVVRFTGRRGWGDRRTRRVVNVG